MNDELGREGERRKEGRRRATSREETENTGVRERNEKQQQRQHSIEVSMYRGTIKKRDHHHPSPHTKHTHMAPRRPRCMLIHTPSNRESRGAFRPSISSFKRRKWRIEWRA